MGISPASTRASRSRRARRCSNSSQGQTRTTNVTARRCAPSLSKGNVHAVRNVLTGESSTTRLLPCLTHRHCRHEMPTADELSKQNVQDRYYGKDDPVAHKILSSHAEDQGLKPPDDETIVRLPFLSEIPK